MPQGKPGTGARAPVDIRALARSHGPMAIQTLAGIAGQPKCKPSDRINASIALLNRGYGAPVADAEGREHINITIRKILEGGAISVVETPQAKVIEHDPVETDER